MKDRALTGTVGTEEQRERAELNANRSSNALEVLDLDGREHQSSPRKARWESDTKSSSATASPCSSCRLMPCRPSKMSANRRIASFVGIGTSFCFRNLK